MICPGVSILLAAASPADRAPISYVVRPGETLQAIGERGLRPACAYDEVRRVNHLDETARLSPGQRIAIPRVLLRAQGEEAVVDSFSGRVVLGAGSNAVAATVGAVVREGAVVQTGPNASVRLKLPDSSVIALPSNSRVRLDRLRRLTLNGALDRAISVLDGRSESAVTPMTDPASRFVVSTPAAVSAVRGTVFRVAYDPARRQGSSGVLKGAVGVSGSGREVLPKAGEGVTADATGVSDPKALLPPPVLRGAAPVQVGDAAGFDIVRQPGAVAHRIRIASDAALAHTVSEGDQAGDHVAVGALPEGAYFAQLTDVAAGGLEGLAAVYPFRRQVAELTGLAVREERGVGQRRYTFAWRLSHAGEATYRFRLVSAAHPGTPVIDRHDLRVAHVEASDLPAGAYTWQVTADLPSAQGGAIVSEPQSLTVDATGW